MPLLHNNNARMYGALSKEERQQIAPLLPQYQPLLIETGMSNPDAAIFTKHAGRERHRHSKTLGC